MVDYFSLSAQLIFDRFFNIELFFITKLENKLVIKIQSWNMVRPKYLDFRGVYQQNG